MVVVSLMVLESHDVYTCIINFGQEIVQVILPYFDFVCTTR